MVLNYLLDIIKERAGFLVLIDPDDPFPSESALREFDRHADAVLIGGSTTGIDDFHEFAHRIKERLHIPVIIFPGNALQVTPHADAILFPSLLTGNNPTYLIEEQVKMAPLVYRYKLEAIPLAYLLVEGGTMTSVHYVTHTLPMPRDKVKLAQYYALAAQYLGFKLLYLESGSGAKLSPPTELIRGIKQYVQLPLIVGGGIKSPDDAHDKVVAGANLVVIGQKLQEDHTLTAEFANAIKHK